MRFTAITFALSLFCISGVSLADNSAPRTVTTSGEAVVRVVPDEAVVTLGITTDAKDVDQARDDNDAIARRLLDQIKAMGVDSKDIQTDTMTVSVRRANYRGAIEGYTSTRQYAITVHDLKKLDEIIHTGFKAGVNELSGPEFRSTESRKHRDHARQLAIHAALEKARLFAAELNATVGSPKTIIEGNARTFSMRAGNLNAESPSPGTDDETTLPAGQLEIRASVTVEFDIIVK